MRFIAAVAFSLAFQAACLAQDLVPRPYASGETRGRVTDAGGAPVEGAVVVVRWNWLGYVAKLEGSGYYYGGDAVHIGEAVTGADGRFAIRAWGPAIRVGGRMEDNAPAIAVFKPGYEPAAGREVDVRLQAQYDEGAPYAQRVRAFQERALAWNYPGDNGKSMPRMVAALQAVKARGAPASASILGTDTLPGRSGAGRVIDAKTGERITYGYVAVEWTLRRADASPGTLRFVQAKRLGTNRHDVQFYVSPYRMPPPNVPGWEIDPAIAPDIAIYAPKYAVYREPKWREAGATIRLDPLPEGREATLAGLREWRRDLDRALAMGAGESAREGVFHLLFAFEDQCRNLTPDLRKGLCYDPASEVGRFIVKPRTTFLVFETREGVEEMPVVSAGGAAAYSAAAGGRTAYTPRVPVSGFSIEPVPR